MSLKGQWNHSLHVTSYIPASQLTCTDSDSDNTEERSDDGRLTKKWCGSW